MRPFLQASLLAACAVAIAAVPGAAFATGGKTAPCSECHSGSGVTLSVTPVSTSGGNATYSASSPAGDIISVFEGSTKRAQINGTSGQFTVTTGKTYTVYAVRGPGKTDGIAKVSVTPPVVVNDTTAPVTTSDALATYARVAAIHLAATDAGPGVVKTYHRLDGGPAVEGRAVLTSAAGMHTVSYWSVDAAGNAETPKSAVFSVTPAPGVVSRLSGSDRFAVAASIARAGWDPTGAKQWTGVRTVIVANGETGKEADPLAAAGLAGVYDAPVLLVKATGVPTSTRSALAEIAARNPGVVVRVIGGTASVPETIASQLRAIAGVSSTRDRITGTDRYQVTANIATRMASVVGASGMGGAYIVNAENPAAFLDALAASPGAYRGRYALLGVRAGSVPASVKQVLDTTLAGKPRYVVNAPTYVSASVYSAVGASRRFSSTTGAYASAAAIANGVMQTAPVSQSQIGVAAKLPDALTGGVYLGKRNGVMLFTTSTSALQPSTSAFVTANAPNVARAWVIGGTTSLPAGQQTQLQNALK